MNAASMRTRGRKRVAAFEPPSGDKRFKLLEVTMKRHQYRQDALIEVLHAAQELFGYLEARISPLRRASPEAAAQPGLRRRHLLPLLHPQAARATHLRRLHRHGLLRQGGGQTAGCRQPGCRRRAGTDHGGRRTVPAHGALPGAVRHRPGRRPRRHGARTRNAGDAPGTSERMAAAWNCRICLTSLSKERQSRPPHQIRCCTAAGCLSAGSAGVLDRLRDCRPRRRAGRARAGRRRRLHAAVLPGTARAGRSQRRTVSTGHTRRRRLDRGRPQRRHGDGEARRSAAALLHPPGVGGPGEQRQGRAGAHRVVHRGRAATRRCTTSCAIGRPRRSSRRSRAAACAAAAAPAIRPASSGRRSPRTPANASSSSATPTRATPAPS